MRALAAGLQDTCDGSLIVLALHGSAAGWQAGVSKPNGSTRMAPQVRHRVAQPFQQAKLPTHRWRQPVPELLEQRVRARVEAKCGRRVGNRQCQAAQCAAG